MNQDRPALIDLLSDVREFVESMKTRLPVDARFDGRIASYLLAVCERELRFGAQQELVWRGQLRGALDSTVVPTGDTRILTRELCQRIRQGEFDSRWDEVMQLALLHVIGKVSIVRPDHLDKLHAPIGSGGG